jgi:hypothetical protein
MRKTSLLGLFTILLNGMEAFMPINENIFTGYDKTRYNGARVIVNRTKKQNYKTGNNQRKRRKLNHWANKKAN